MVKKVHGYSYFDDSVTGDMHYYLFRTGIDIRPTGIVAEINDPNYIDEPQLPYTDLLGNTHTTAAAYNAARLIQVRFDNLIKAISIFGQPVILGKVVTTTEIENQTNIPAYTGTTPMTVYNLRFALEKTALLVEEDLVDVLDGISGFVGLPLTSRNFRLLDDNFLF